MAERITILTLEDRERWEAEHRLGGLPSQSWLYAWGLSASGFSPKLAVVESGGARMLLPFFERFWREATDVATIPGLSGASVSPVSAAPLWLWRDYAISQSWVAGYIQLAAPIDLSGIPPDSRLVAHNAVFIFDLRDWKPNETASQTIRRKVAAALSRGATVVDDIELLIESLNQLYPATMRRLGSAEKFSAATLRRWAAAPTSLILGVRLGDSIEAVHLAHLSGEHAEWHIAATTEGGRALAALIFWNAPEFLRERNVRFSNIGGGTRIGDGVFQFKLRLGGVPTPLQSLRQVYDRDKYDEFCVLAGVSSESKWFPAFRAAREIDPNRRSLG
jgi:hypothetical protein